MGSLRLFHALTFLLLIQIPALNAFAKSSSLTVNPKAPKGGVVNLNLWGEPPTLNPFASTDVYASKIQDLVLESLLERDGNTRQPKSRLAEKWEISKDHTVYTFHLRKNVKFHDGQPFTAEDVKFSFDAIFDPKFKAMHRQPSFDGIAKVEVVDPMTVKVTTKNTYFLNFDSIAYDLRIVPKHVYEDANNSAKNRLLIGTGPYILDKFDPGQRLVLKRNLQWYGFSTADWQGYYNFDQMNYRFVKDENVTLELLKKGDLDFCWLSPEGFATKTQDPPWGKSVFKTQVENSSPKGFGYVGFNLHKTLFADKNVRLALASLMNREEMNKKFRFGKDLLATGPFYQQSEYASKKVKPIQYDPQKALQLLNKAGWKDDDKTGVLHKMVDGKSQDFHFTLLYTVKDLEKYLTIFKEDLKKVGVQMDLQILEWNSFLKLLHDGNFEATFMGWSEGMDWDPKAVWHSSSAANGGFNEVEYKNPAVDQLIDKARLETNREERMKMMHKIYEMIAEDVPYIFMFNGRYDSYAYSNRVVRPGETMKYAIGFDTWWMANP